MGVWYKEGVDTTPHHTLLKVFSWHSKTLYFYAKWFLITARASFAVILMQKRGMEPSPGRVNLKRRQVGGGDYFIK